MKSPIDYAARALRFLEQNVIPWQAIWWNAYTPHIPAGDRYQDGYFEGYWYEQQDEEWPMEHSLIRKLHRLLPFFDPGPVKRPAHTTERDDLVIEMTTTMYRRGKALYTKENIAWVEDQLDQYDAKLARRKGARPVGKLLSKCEAPQTAWVKYKDFDGVVQHQNTWMNNSWDPTTRDDGMGPVHGRPQIEFRTIQELVMPDPDNTNEVFANDQWEQSVAYNSMFVRWRYTHARLVEDTHANSSDQRGPPLSMALLIARFEGYKETIKKSEEWKGLMEMTRVDYPESETLRGIDKIVYFYCKDMYDNCDYCQRATYLLALASCIRELVLAARGEYGNLSSQTKDSKSGDAGPSTTNNGQEISIYMPETGIFRRWRPNELKLLQYAGIVLVPTNGKLFLKVDANSAVISYRNWNPVKQVVADLARPAMVVCKPPREKLERDFAWLEEDRDGEIIFVPVVRGGRVDGGVSVMSMDPDSPRVREMLDCGEEDDTEERELDGRRRFVGEKRMKRRGNYRRVGDVPTLPGNVADKEMLTMYVRRKGARKEVDYWS